MNIAIDGPAGAGKSTVARQVASRLKLLYIDTGAMYRALTYAAIHRDCPLTDEERLHSLLESIQITLDALEDGQHVYVDGHDVTNEVRMPVVTDNVSQVSAYPSIRQRMVQLQRELARNKSVVMDGRDIGTHVLPDAELKIFLTASHEERAQRRYHELVNRGIEADLPQLAVDIAERDRKDSERETAPLRQASDAVLLDTTGISVDEVVNRIVTLYLQVKEHAEA
ncbi:(d)CMP kinase [Aneurinibacillus sp. Ricciae_BoGa-3]|uniref:(d)CMP kinase n=1 Tax=Aneurinibacillus sp. Ricciae_BoGa-3 TaxID=3022697 RepID=UPI002341DD77|nr:(d)CMP kinase [Aneurinibacillus sp. Ricciae_BoGa-3]WCK56061.1 (d)CMP kinase [Aneurinibacillus sp. Ricciae_BoGa-3]